MIPFVTQFRAEEDLKHNRKVLVTFAHINHNTVVVSRCAEIANNLAGNKVNHKFTQNPEIRNGLELFFYNWKKVNVYIFFREEVLSRQSSNLLSSTNLHSLYFFAPRKKIYLR